MSRTIRPVTQVALVAVNSASTTPSLPCLLARGVVSSSVPSVMTTRKLTQMICVGFGPLRRLPAGCPNSLFFLLFSISSSARGKQLPRLSFSLCL